MSKEIKDLTNLEIVEDLSYYLYITQLRSEIFNDEMFDILKKYLKELGKRFKNV